MVQIFYKKSGYNYSFCTADYYQDKELKNHSLQLNKGNVGELNNCEVLVTDNYYQIEAAFNSIKLEYPDKQPETIKIKLIIDLKDFVQTLANQKRLQTFILHLWQTARFAILFSGQNLFYVPEPNRNTKLVDNKYEMEFEIIEKHSFFAQFFALSSYCGIKLHQIKVEEL